MWPIFILLDIKELDSIIDVVLWFLKIDDNSFAQLICWFCDILSWNEFLNFFSEHMLFMGSSDFPDENEVCLVLYIKMLILWLQVKYPYITVAIVSYSDLID